MHSERWFPDFGWKVNAERGQDIMSVGVEATMDLLRTGGAVLFSGFDLSSERFDEFSTRFQKEHTPHIFTSSVRPPLNKDATVIDVFSGQDTVSLHGEMYFVPRHPNVLWFYCILPSEVGGQTTLCDGVRYLAALSERTRRTLCERPIVYKVNCPATGWKKLTKKDDAEEAMVELRKMPGVRAVTPLADGGLRYEYVASAIGKCRFGGDDTLVNSILNVTEERYLGLDLVRCMFADDEPFPAELLRELESAGSLVSRYVEWRPNELLLVDNTRMQHGRTRFVGPRSIRTRHMNTP